MTTVLLYFLVLDDIKELTRGFCMRKLGVAKEPENTVENSPRADFEMYQI